MNENYSKQEILLKSIRKTLIDDDSVLSSIVREINYYVSNRVTQGVNAVSLDAPYITMDVDDGMSEQLLPSGEFFVLIKCWVEQDSDLPNDTLNRLSTRIIFLLNKKHNELNTQYPLEKLRCRLILKQSNTKQIDAIRKLFNRTILFRIIADDEILVC